MTIQAIEEGMVAKIGIAVADLAIATETGPAIETKNFDEAFFVFQVGDATTGDITVTIEEGDTSGGSFTAIAGAAFPVVTSANDLTIYNGRIRVKNFKSFIRVIAVVGTASIEASVTVNLWKFDGLAPVTQVNATSFALDFVQDGGTPSP